MLDIPISALTEAQAAKGRDDLVTGWLELADNHTESAKLLRERKPYPMLSSAQLHQEEAARLVARAERFMACTAMRSLEMLVEQQEEAAQTKTMGHLGVIAEA